MGVLLASVVKMMSPVVLAAGSKPRLQAPTTRHTPSGLWPHLICIGQEMVSFNLLRTCLGRSSRFNYNYSQSRLSLTP